MKTPSRSPKPEKCNTKEGILGYTGSLAGIRNLFIEREHLLDASFRDKELDDFVVLGYIYVGKRHGEYPSIIRFPDPRDVIPILPNVVTYKEFLNYKGVLSAKLNLEQVFPMPNDHVCCPECGLGWTVQTLDDVRSLQGDRGQGVTIPMTNFHNETFATLKRKMAMWTDAIYECAGMTYRNGKSSCHPVDKFVIQSSDSLHVNKWELFHGNCLKRRLTKNRASALEKSFLEVGCTYADVEVTARKTFEDGPGILFRIATDRGMVDLWDRSRHYHVDLRRTRREGIDQFGTIVEGALMLWKTNLTDFLKFFLWP